jgi:nucleotide-binding universal stress UspA family protein
LKPQVALDTPADLRTSPASIPAEDIASHRHLPGSVHDDLQPAIDGERQECRRAVRDAIPLLQRAEEVLILHLAEDGAESEAKKVLADVGAYLGRHRVVVADEIWRRARGPVATELLRFVQDEKADLIVAGGYGHSRLGEWIFGGVTHELLSASPVCCLLSH